MKSSKISLFAVEGNMFDMKAFHQLDGYDDVSAVFMGFFFRSFDFFCFLLMLFILLHRVTWR